LRWRGERYILHRATGFPYISPISSVLRWREKRYIPKNVFFLREEVLIYDAPESATFPHTSPSHRISIYFSYILHPPLEGKALHSQECFLPPRGGFNLRCTRERYIPKNVFFPPLIRSPRRKRCLDFPFGGFKATPESFDHTL